MMHHLATAIALGRVVVPTIDLDLDLDLVLDPRLHLDLDLDLDIGRIAITWSSTTQNWIC